MKTLLIITCVALGLFLLSACQVAPYQGRAREVKRKPMEGGIIALTVDHRPEDRMKADEKMKSNCNTAPVKVLEEGEVVVGETTTSNQSDTYRPSTKRKAGKVFGMNIMTGEEAGTDTRTSSSTTQLKEWQISYECSSKKKARL